MTHRYADEEITILKALLKGAFTLLDEAAVTYKDHDFKRCVEFLKQEAKVR